MKKTFSFISIFLYAAFALLFFPATSAKAGSVTDTISIYIGYFGWDEDQFVEKSTFDWRELDDLFGGVLISHEHVYSYYSGSRTYLVAARGFYIRDLLEYAGIDFGSISRIDFFTKDQTIGAYRSFTKASLFDMPRYYFPNLAADINTGEVYPYYGEDIDDIYDGAIRVEPMLALEDYTEWDSVGFLFEDLYDSTMFSASSRFHLFFGQLSPTEANTSSAAKYVYKLFITFSGTPVLSTDTTNIELKVGSDFRMTVNVSAEDSLLDAYVMENLVWSSDNESVVSVDSSGVLNVKAEGEAVITAAFGSSSVSVGVRVSGNAEEIEPMDGEGGDSSEGSSDSAGSGSGAASSESSVAQPSATGDVIDSIGSTMQAVPYRDEEADEYDDIPDLEYDDISDLEYDRSVYVLSSGFVSREDFQAWTGSILSSGYAGNSSEGALLNARREGMGDDAEQLILLQKEKKDFMAGTGIVLGAFFATGFGYGVVRFKRAVGSRAGAAGAGKTDL